MSVVATDLKWTDQQEAIFRWFETGRGNLVVRARAGTGKSTSIAEGVRRRPAATSTLVAAFNKEIQEDLAKRFDDGAVEVKTLHGLGFAFVRRARPELEIDEARGRALADRAVRRRQDEEVPEDVIAVVKKLASLAKGAAPLALRAADILDLALEHDCVPEEESTPGYWAAVAEADDFFPEDEEAFEEWKRERVCRWAIDAMALATDLSDGKIDFDDMVFLPVRLGWTRAWFDLVVVDEAQDMNAAQLILATKACRRGGRICVVGDDRQCAPPGSLVSVRGWGQRQIESLKDGDRVIAFARHEKALIGARDGFPVKVASREYRGDLVRIRVGDKTTRTTPNHRWLVRWSDRDDRDTTCVYVMRRGDRFRVGWCQLFTNDGVFHLGARANIEAADALWVLRTFKDRTDASVYESIVAAKYGLPTVTFEPVDGAKHLTREAIDRIFDALGTDEHGSRAVRCLADHGRELQQPLWPPIGKEFGKMGRTTLFETWASNLEQNLMSVPVPAGASKEVDYAPIDEVTREPYDGLVYSLDVATHGTYIQDGIVTHNSIYGFRGADTGAIDRMKAELRAEELGLTVTRRCPRRVVEVAARLVPDFRAAEGAPEGEVRAIYEDQLVTATTPAPGDFLLSRKNAPLASFCLKLLKQGRRAKIRGKDIGRGLVSLVRKIAGKRCNDVVRFTEKLAAWKDREVRRWKALRKDRQAEEAADKAECLAALCEGLSGVRELVERLEALFTDDNAAGRDAVILSSVHRAKGLEADRVYLLEGTLYPGGRQTREEQNIHYVAVTRAKKELVLVRERKEGK